MVLQGQEGDKEQKSSPHTLPSSESPKPPTWLVIREKQREGGEATYNREEVAALHGQDRTPVDSVWKALHASGALYRWRPIHTSPPTCV